MEFYKVQKQFLKLTLSQIHLVRLNLKKTMTLNIVKIVKVQVVKPSSHPQNVQIVQIGMRNIEVKLHAMFVETLVLILI